MYEVPAQKQPEVPSQRVYPTNEDSLRQAITEIDIALVKEDYLLTYVKGIKNRLKLLFCSKKHKELIRKQLLQLDFLLAAEIRLKEEELNFYVYAILGAFQYVTGRWGEFPNTGPLFELRLKKDDLLQVISGNMPDIKLEHLFTEPTLINRRADEAFAKFLAKYPDLTNKIS